MSTKRTPRNPSKFYCMQQSHWENFFVTQPIFSTPLSRPKMSKIFACRMPPTFAWCERNPRVWLKTASENNNNSNNNTQQNKHQKKKELTQQNTRRSRRRSRIFTEGTDCCLLPYFFIFIFCVWYLVVLYTIGTHNSYIQHNKTIKFATFFFLSGWEPKDGKIRKKKQARKVMKKEKKFQFYCAVSHVRSGFLTQFFFSLCEYFWRKGISVKKKENFFCGGTFCACGAVARVAYVRDIGKWWNVMDMIFWNWIETVDGKF